ncbi:hypothetical protein [Bacteroides sp. HPS0048]|uniref:hypothetical protein n=1 Tax=Bacteroides sp. HPS0048 TaxID=1078089 RepID=UPI003565F671
MKHTKSLTCLLTLFSFITSVTIKAQDDREWHTIQIEKLGISASFYQQPTATTKLDGEEKNYRFENIVEEGEHPNKSYLISIWETTNPSDPGYAEKKEMQLITQKLHGSNLELMDKNIFPKGGVPITQYTLKNINGEYILFLIGYSKNKVYTSEIHCKKDQGFNYECLKFIQSFYIDNYIKEIQKISLDSLSCSILFPYPPEVYKIDNPEPEMIYAIEAYAPTPQKEEEVTIWIGEEEKTIKMYQYEDSVSYYKLSEALLSETIPETMSAETMNLLLQHFVHSMVSTSNGKLIKKEEIQRDNLQGIAITVQSGNTTETLLYHMFLKNRKIYILMAALQRGVRTNYPAVTRFMESFHIK